MKTAAPCIVLIERDEITLEIYRRELQKSFNVITFLDLNGILETLQDPDIRAVVIEPEISSGRGWDLIDSIHNAFPGRSIPVIVCSTRDASRESAGQHISRYLTKPVLPKSLREITLDVLGRQGND